MTENLMPLPVFSGCELSMCSTLASGRAPPLDTMQCGCARKHIAHAMTLPPVPR